MVVESQRIFYLTFSGKDYPSRVLFVVWTKDTVNRMIWNCLILLFLFFFTDFKVANFLVDYVGNISYS
jgi:hypothetical protein